MNYDTVYRIHTEHTNLALIEANLASRFDDGYTLFEAGGCYKGTQERSLVIEVWSEGDTMFPAVQSAANAIKKANDQEAVCVTVTRAVFLQF